MADATTQAPAAGAPNQSTPPAHGGNSETRKPDEGPISDAAPPKSGDPSSTPDPRAELNKAIKAAGLRLKAKDREIPVESVDDLLSRAQRVYGVENLMAEAKSERAKADEILKLRAQLESDNEDEALEAYAKLTGKRGEHLAIAKAKRLYEQSQEEAQLTERERQFKRLAEEQAASLREYRKREEAEKAKAEEASRAAELERVREEVATVTLKALEALKWPKERLNAVLPRVAGLMRLAAEAGQALSPEDLAKTVESELRADWSQLTSGLPPEALFDWLGEDSAKAIAREYLRRVKAVGAPKASPTEPRQETQQANGPRRGQAGYFRY